MSIKAMKQALAALEAEQALRQGYSYLGGVRVVSTADAAINALRAAIQQTEGQQPATGEPVWFHKHWGDDDDIFYRPDDKIPPVSTPLYTHPAPSLPDPITPPTEDGTEYDYASGYTAGYAAGWNDYRDGIAWLLEAN